MITSNSSSEYQLQIFSFLDTVLCDLGRMKRGGHNDFSILEMLLKFCMIMRDFILLFRQKIFNLEYA